MTDEKLKEYERVFARMRASYNNCIQITNQWHARIDNELKNGMITIVEYRRELEQIKDYNEKVRASLDEYGELLQKLQKKQNLRIIFDWNICVIH